MIRINLFSEIRFTLCFWGNNSLFEKDEVISAVNKIHISIPRFIFIEPSL